jgi:hypothetical protein
MAQHEGFSEDISGRIEAFILDPQEHLAFDLLLFLNNYKENFEPSLKDVQAIVPERISSIDLKEINLLLRSQVVSNQEENLAHGLELLEQIIQVIHDSAKSKARLEMNN